MGTLIILELKKMFLKKRILIVWMASLFLSFVSIRAFSIEETYADIFSKAYGLVPLMGIIIFMIFSAAYTLEYSSNMAELIKTTKNGKRTIVLAKSIAAGVSASIINISVFLTVVLSGLIKFNFDGLNIPLKSLWYFGNSGSDITVLKMILITILTIILGSLLFAQIGLFISSISKSATAPFIFGGLIMGLPYILEGFLSRIGLARYLALTPLWGMMSFQMIRYNASTIAPIILIIMFILLLILLPKLTLKAFIKER